MINTAKQGVFTTVLKNGCTNFYIKYSLNNKQYKVKLGSDEDGWTVNKAYKERQKRISNNVASVSNRTSLKFCDAFESYMDSISHKTDCYNSKSRYKTHLKDSIGHYRLGDITPLLLLKLKSKLSEEDAVKTGKPLAPRSIDGVMDLVNQTYNFHIRIGSYNGTSPATPKLVARFSVDNSRLSFLSQEDYTNLMYRLEHRTEFYINTKPHITQQLKLFVMLGVTTGGRRGTLLTIKVKDINFKEGTILLHNHKVGRIYQGYIHPAIREYLLATVATLSAEHYIIGGKDKPLCPTTISKRLQPILNDMFNVGVTDRRERVVVHTLRHTFGSWLAQANTSLYQIMKLMDHSQMSQTQMYAKLLPNSGANEVAKLIISL